LFVSGIVVLIFLLSLLQYGINGGISQDDSKAGEENDASNKSEENVNQARHGPIADAIHTYRRYCHADERGRAQRERVTIVVLISTAIFAFLAAVAAGVSAWGFQGQLTAMREDRRAWIGTIPPYFISDAAIGQSVNVWFAYILYERWSRAAP